MRRNGGPMFAGRKQVNGWHGVGDVAWWDSRNRKCCWSPSVMYLMRLRMSTLTWLCWTLALTFEPEADKRAACQGQRRR